MTAGDGPEMPNIGMDGCDSRYQCDTTWCSFGHSQSCNTAEGESGSTQHPALLVYQIGLVGKGGRVGAGVDLDLGRYTSGGHNPSMQCGGTSWQ